MSSDLYEVMKESRSKQRESALKALASVEAEMLMYGEISSPTIDHGWDIDIHCTISARQRGDAYEVMKYARQKRRDSALIELLSVEMVMISLGELERFTKEPNVRDGQRSTIVKTAFKAREQVQNAL